MPSPRGWSWSRLKRAHGRASTRNSYMVPRPGAPSQGPRRRTRQRKCTRRPNSFWRCLGANWRRGWSVNKYASCSLLPGSAHPASSPNRGYAWPWSTSRRHARRRRARGSTCMQQLWRPPSKFMDTICAMGLCANCPLWPRAVRASGCRDWCGARRKRCVSGGARGCPTRRCCRWVDEWTSGRMDEWTSGRCVGTTSARVADGPWHQSSSSSSSRGATVGPARAKSPWRQGLVPQLDYCECAPLLTRLLAVVLHHGGADGAPPLSPLHHMCLSPS